MDEWEGFGKDRAQNIDNYWAAPLPRVALKAVCRHNIGDYFRR
jgi:hypothetical protein